MRKSDKIENKLRIQLESKEGFTWKELWEAVYTNKALLKHVIDNELPHIWKVILIILSYLVMATAGFIIKGIF